ncbi:hypothetical protein BpHYR1_005058 [Brachionus plicatilis]|uniref:Uncharacterized protein n=1 Tax=Brachionus plicatilis TaxID=10195 RepID=A0A3M7T6V1_BRAPC|nr:hypothetical protein BpHYR1_005058 [Brachionus plicatilis]
MVFGLNDERGHFCLEAIGESVAVCNTVWSIGSAGQKSHLGDGVVQRRVWRCEKKLVSFTWLEQRQQAMGLDFFDQFLFALEQELNVVFLVHARLSRRKLLYFGLDFSDRLVNVDVESFDVIYLFVQSVYFGSLNFFQIVKKDFFALLKRLQVLHVGLAYFAGHCLCFGLNSTHHLNRFGQAVFENVYDLS